MKNMILIGPLPPPYGGVSVFCQSFRRLLTENHQEPFFINTSSGEENERFDRITFSNWIVFFRNIPELIQTLLSKQPEFVYVLTTSDFGFFRDIVFAMIAKLFGKKVIFHFHGDDKRYFFSGQNRLVVLLWNWMMKLVDDVIVLTPYIAQKYQQLLNRPVSVIPNFVERNRIAFKQASTDQSIQKMDFVFMGRLSERKGVFDLLRAIDGMEEIQNVRFHFLGTAGTAADKNKLEELVRGHRFKSKLLFHGILKDKDKFDFLNQCDIFIFPTYEEVFPMSLLEAMACGLPVVASRVDSIPDLIIEGENGLLIDPGNLEQIQMAIQMMIANSKDRLRMSGNNVRKVREKYSDVVVWDLFHHLFYNNHN